MLTNLACCAAVVAGAQHLLSRVWVPPDDDAIIFLRAQDVGTRHTPLVGLYSRWGWDHPGPILFSLLSVPIRLLDQRPSAMLVGILVLVLTFVSLAVHFAGKAGGATAALAVGVGSGILLAGLQGRALDPWTPYVVIVPLVTFVCALWAWSSGDRPALPVAVALGSFLVQTHVGLLVPVACTAFTASLLRWRHQARRNLPLVSAATTILLWAQPVWQQLTGKVGNLSQLWRFFAEPPPAGIVGLPRGLEMTARLLLPWGPWVGAEKLTLLATPLPAPTWWLAFPLLALAGASLGSWLWRDAVVGRLVALTAAAAGSSLIAEARVVGLPYGYLTGWTRSASCLIVLCPVILLCRRVRVDHRLSAFAVAALIVLPIGLLDGVPQRSTSEAYGRLLAPAVTAVPPGSVVRVVSEDLGFAAPETSLVVELDRHERTGLLPTDTAGAWRMADPKRALPTFVFAGPTAADTLRHRSGAAVVASSAHATLFLLPTTAWP